MAVGLYLHFRASSPRQWRIIKPLLASPMVYCWCQIKRFSQRNGGHCKIDVKASSTAEEFKRVAEEKLKEAKQGIAGQVSDKTYDGAEDTVLGDPNLESEKKRYEEHELHRDYRRRGDKEP